LEKKKKAENTLPLNPSESDTVIHADPPAEDEHLNLLGDSHFGTPKIENLHKDLHAFEAQNTKSLPEEPARQVSKLFHECKLNSFYLTHISLKVFSLFHFYGAVDPAVSLPALKAAPTVKSAFSQCFKEEQSSHNLEPKKKKALKIPLLTLDAATLQSTKKLQDLCFVNCRSQSKLQ
jgi:hypothetical protein